MKGLKGKRVIVTGGSSGIGSATAIAFAEVGAHVLINHLHDEAGAARTITEIEAKAPTTRHASLQADLGEPDGVEAIFDACRRELGGVDILINNAGIKRPGDPIDYSVESFDRVMAVNLRGAFLAAQAAIRHFRKHGIQGVIVNTSSIHETSAHTWDIGYAMSKGGLAMMTRTLALAVAKDRIRVNNVAPGAIDTPMNAIWHDQPETLGEIVRRVPLGRVASADEIARSIIFLASDYSAYTTGQTLYVDGGLML